MSDQNNLVEAPCGECGEPVAIPAPYHDECVDWDMPSLDELDETNCIPKEELEALADGWEDFVGQSWDGYSSGVNDATESCAQELREVLEQYE